MNSMSFGEFSGKMSKGVLWDIVVLVNYNFARKLFFGLQITNFVDRAGVRIEVMLK